MWRLAGDTASDFNHYTKRMTLSAVYASLLAVFVNDESENFADSRAFLDRRIDNVMQFEKVKAQAKIRAARYCRARRALSGGCVIRRVRQLRRAVLRTFARRKGTKKRQAIRRTCG